MNASELSAGCSLRIAGSGSKVVARIADGRATDLAVALPGDRLIIVRCTETATSADRSALATMVAEGDFDWAALVYSDQSGTDWSGDVEAFHLSEMSRLIERLHELKRAAAS